MKRLLLTLTICLAATLSAYADDDKDDNDKSNKPKTDATEMTILGLTAASVLAAGSYLVYRRRLRR